MNRNAGSRVVGRGTRTDLACPKCGGRMGGLHVRENRAESEGEPGFPSIGRECDACGHRVMKRRFRPGRCSKHEPEPLYKRAPRPSQLFEPHGTICLHCGRA